MKTGVLEKQVKMPDTISRFRIVVVAALRAKQLVRGAKPRIENDSTRRKNTSIALEEVRRDLVGFSVLVPKAEHDSVHSPGEVQYAIPEIEKPASVPI